MKFTIDLENKKILIHDSFNRKDLDHLFSLLNIENMDEFVIDKYVAPYPSQPTTSPNDYWYSTTTTPINNTLTPLTLVYNSIEDLVDELN
jgi:hypothetical protein